MSARVVYYLSTFLVRVRGPWRVAYRDFKVDHLVCESGHFIVEAEPILSGVLCRKDKIPLSLLLSFHDLLVVGSYHGVIDVEGSAGLHLFERVCVSQAVKKKTTLLSNSWVVHRLESHTAK